MIRDFGIRDYTVSRFFFFLGGGGAGGAQDKFGSKGFRFRV